MYDKRTMYVVCPSYNKEKKKKETYKPVKTNKKKIQVNINHVEDMMKRESEWESDLFFFFFLVSGPPSGLKKSNFFFFPFTFSFSSCLRHAWSHFLFFFFFFASLFFSSQQVCSYIFFSFYLLDIQQTLCFCHTIISL